MTKNIQLRPIGIIRSRLKLRKNAPRQGSEGAPDAWLEIRPWAMAALHRLDVGDEVFVITWFHKARRDVMQVRPRSDPRNAITGVFATRSPDRPNPLGLHPVIVRAIEKNRLRIGPIEAIDGTPVVDIKPVLNPVNFRSADQTPAFSEGILGCAHQQTRSSRHDGDCARRLRRRT